MKKVTIDTLQTAKLSDMVESVVQDVKRMTAKGFKINMDAWIMQHEFYCCVCLGGAAACGFLSDEDIPKAFETDGTRYSLALLVNHGKEDAVSSLISLFNAVRVLAWGDVADHYSDITGILLDGHKLNKLAQEAELRYYSGQVAESEVDAMCDRLLTFADLLRRIDY